jgi:hypothetical protein
VRQTSTLKIPHDEYEIFTEDHYDSVHGCIWYLYIWNFRVLVHLSTGRMVS